MLNKMGITGRFGGMCVHRIFCRKNLFLLVLLYIFVDIHLMPIKSYAGAVGCKVSPYIFPFLISDANFLLIFMAGVIYFFSDVPFVTQAERYYLLREGKVQWMKEQIAYIMISSLLIPIGTVLVCWLSLIRVLHFEKGWGKVIYTLAKTNAGEQSGLFWKISLHYISEHQPLEAMCTSVLIIGLGISFIGLFMFISSMYLGKSFSMVAAAVMAAYSSVVANVGVSSEKNFFVFSPVSWMRVTRLDFTQYGYKVAWSASESIFFFLILIFLLSFAGWMKSKKMDFI